MALYRDASGIEEQRFGDKLMVVCGAPVVWVGEESEPIRRDTLGNPVRYCGALIDVTGQMIRATMDCGHAERHQLGTHATDSIGTPGY